MDATGEAFRFSYDAFYSFYTTHADDPDLFEPSDAVCAHVYEAARHRNGAVWSFATQTVATVRRVRHARDAHGVYFLAPDLAQDARRSLRWVFPQPCENRATGKPEPYLVANHLSFLYDQSLAEKQVRFHSTLYDLNKNEDPSVVHVHDPFDDGVVVSASGEADAFIKKNRAYGPLIMDVLRRPFVRPRSPSGLSGGARKPVKKARRPPVAAAARAALVAACNRAFGGLAAFSAVGVREPDGAGWTYSVELSWDDGDWPEGLKVPACFVRCRAAGRAAFERAFARLLNDGPTRAQRLREHEYTSF